MVTNFFQQFRELCPLIKVIHLLAKTGSRSSITSKSEAHQSFALPLWLAQFTHASSWSAWVTRSWSAVALVACWSANQVARQLTSLISYASVCVGYCCVYVWYGFSSISLEPRKMSWTFLAQPYCFPIVCWSIFENLKVCCINLNYVVTCIWFQVDQHGGRWQCQSGCQGKRFPLALWLFVHYYEARALFW